MDSGIRRVGVIGVGLMGGGIAQVSASRGFDTVVVDMTEEILVSGMNRIRDSLERRAGSYQKSSGKVGITQEEKEKVLSRIHLSTDQRDLLNRDVLIEAVVENEKTKKEIISSIGEKGYRGLLVSNTSSISITRLASVYPAQEKFMGMHFMNPVPLQPGCELIRGLLTSEDTWLRVTAFCRELGKEPIFSEDKAGFGINRMFVPFLLEAVKVVEEGIMTCEDADKVTLCLGHKMGPITTLDYVGLDTTLAIAQVLERELGPAYKPPDLLRKLVTAGFSGMKNGKGFYFWDKSKKIRINPVVERYRRSS